MQQAINLFDHLDQKAELRFSAKQGVIAVAVLAGLMLLVSVGLALNTNIQKKALFTVQKERDLLQETLAALQAKAASNASTDVIASLRSEIEIKRSLLASVGDGSEPAFSEYMAGLGRQHINGLWLEKVKVEKKGGRIAISGAMQKASLLPRYLQLLGNENVFQGVRFQLMKIEEQPLKKQQMKFEVAVASENDDDRQGGES